MKQLGWTLVASLFASAVLADTIGFDQDPTGAVRVEFASKRIKVSLDGKQYIDLDDDHIAGPGAVGLWTKADSVTAFDEFSWGGK